MNLTLLSILVVAATLVFLVLVRPLHGAGTKPGVLANNKMKAWHKVTLLVLALVLINTATWFVTGMNQRNGVYPVDADSIGIPIIGTWFNSLFVLPQLFLIGLLARLSFVRVLCSRHIGWSIILGILLLALYVSVGLFAISGVVEWMFPNHYLIAFCYLLLLLMLVVLLFLDIHLLFSESTFQRHAPKRTP